MRWGWRARPVPPPRRPPRRPASVSRQHGHDPRLQLALPRRSNWPFAGYGGIEPWISDLESSRPPGSLATCAAAAPTPALRHRTPSAFAPVGGQRRAAARRASADEARHGAVAALGARTSRAAGRRERGGDGDRLRPRRGALPGHPRSRPRGGRDRNSKFWGSSANEPARQALHFAAPPATPSLHPADVFHLYKGGSDSAALRCSGPPACTAST